MKKIHCKIWTKDEFGKELNFDEWYHFNLFKLHREDGPAVIFNNGAVFWYLDGKRHRLDGPAIKWATGGIEWWSNGRLHREDGPAVEASDETKHWYINGKRHREDGPAIEYEDGSNHWFLNDKILTREKFDWIKENNIDIESEQGKLLFKMRFE